MVGSYKCEAQNEANRDSDDDKGWYSTRGYLPSRESSGGLLNLLGAAAVVGGIVAGGAGLYYLFAS